MPSATAAANQVIRADVQAISEELGQVLAPLAGATLLVTGGSGFLCSYLLETIAWLNETVWDDPCRVISLDNLRTGAASRVAHLAGRPDSASSITMFPSRSTWVSPCNGSSTAPV